MTDEQTLKPGWRRVKFGDVVRLSKARSANPEADGIERYVGLDHIDPEDLRIRRWGLVAEGTTFTTRFKPGQVLFGKRRAYQRKVAVADFEGVCSGDIYVFESADPSVLLPDLLPFICQTNRFCEYAVSTSAGSLSPRTNWNNLINFEFVLPTLKEQSLLARQLKASTQLTNALDSCITATERLLTRLLLDEYTSACQKWPTTAISSVGEVLMGRQKAPKYRQGKSPFPFLKVANIGDLSLNLAEVEEMDFTANELDKYRLQPGDILITEGDLISSLNVGRPALYEGQPKVCCFQNTLIRFRPSSQLSSHYALMLFEGARLSGIFSQVAKTTTVTHLGVQRFSQMKIPLPPIEIQQISALRFKELLQCRSTIRERLISAQHFQRSSIEEAILQNKKN